MPLGGHVMASEEKGIGMTTQEQALSQINDGISARELLKNANPNYQRRFFRLCTTMTNLLHDVRQDFPDAEYYTASGGFNLLIGKSHDRDGRQQQDLEALGGIGVEVGDGDY